MATQRKISQVGHHFHPIVVQSLYCLISQNLQILVLSSCQINFYVSAYASVPVTIVATILLLLLFHHCHRLCHWFFLVHHFSFFLYMITVALALLLISLADVIGSLGIWFSSAVILLLNFQVSIWKSIL